MRGRIARLFWGVLLFVSLANCAAPTPAPKVDAVTVRLSWKHSTQFLGFYVADAKGYYAAENLAVTILPLDNSFEMDKIPGQVAAGQVDFAVGGQALIEAHQDISVTLIASLYQFSPAALFARKSLGIRTPADLAGHTVAVKSQGWEVLIDELLDSYGLPPTAITKVKAGFDMTPFYDGQVDVWSGWITSEVAQARLKGLDITTLPLYEYGIRNRDNMIYTGQTLAAANPGLVVRFLRATLRGWDWAAANPSEAVEIFLARFPAEAAQRDFHMLSFAASIPLIIPRGVRAGALDCGVPQFRDELLKAALCDETFWRQARGDK